MSMTSDLVKGYGRFFEGAARFAVSPYTATFFSIGRQGNGSFDPVTAGLAVAALTFVVPVLPTLFSITGSLAMVGASIAIASMFILFPCALIWDLITGNPGSNGYNSAPVHCLNHYPLF